MLSLNLKIDRVIKCYNPTLGFIFEINQNKRHYIARNKSLSVAILIILLISVYKIYDTWSTFLVLSLSVRNVLLRVFTTYALINFV